MNKLSAVFVLTILVLPLCAQNNKKETEYYTGYEGVVLGEKTPRSATDSIAQQAVQSKGIFTAEPYSARNRKNTTAIRWATVPAPLPNTFTIHPWCAPLKSAMRTASARLCIPT